MQESSLQSCEHREFGVFVTHERNSEMLVNRYFRKISTKSKDPSIAHQHLQKRCITQTISNRLVEKEETRRRVVVTGVGIVSPVGCSAQSAWKNIQNGMCGIKQLKGPAFETLPCKIAAKINEDDLKLNEKFSKSELRSLAPATAYALIAGTD